MGVSAVIPFSLSASDAIIQLSREEMLKRLSDLGASKSGNFSMDYEVFNASSTNDMQSSLASMIHVLHHSECPHSTFCILDNGSKMTCESSFDSILAKMKPYFSSKKSQTGSSSVVEIKGSTFTFVDFIFRIGAIHFGANPKFFTLEVEYVPCSYQSKCKSLIDEIVSDILGRGCQLSRLTTFDSSGVKSGEHEEAFTKIDCVESYLKILTSLKQTGNINFQHFATLK